LIRRLRGFQALTMVLGVAMCHETTPKWESLVEIV
jgi:hypothetical protein